jgi:hypothetical protein
MATAIVGTGMGYTRSYLRTGLVALLLFQLVIGNAVHANRLAREAALEALGLGAICSADGGAKVPDKPFQHPDEDCCILSCTCSMGTPLLESVTAWTPVPAVKRAFLAFPTSASIAGLSRYPSDLAARAPPTTAG